MKSCFVICVVFCQASLILSQPMVKIEQGWIVGETIHFENDFLDIQKDVDVFLGIPYAEPPIGDNRFRAPQPKQPWSEGEIYYATYNRDVCMQTSREADLILTKSEDCLHLNVYTPKQLGNNSAVMVFIHGGGYGTGNGYFGYYSGVPLSTIGDVIIVTINYRLTAFGFLTTGDEASPGNYGMLDQVEALRWVQTNIQAFGGDPNRVTIFGESAGAGSVSAHLLSPLSRDLFQQAILESGSILCPWSFHYDLDGQRDIAYKIGEIVGCPATSTQQLISCMRGVDAAAINAAAGVVGYIPSPCVDNNFLIESPLTSIETGNFKKCPLIDGFNKDEGTLYIIATETGYQYFNSSTAPPVSQEAFDKELSLFLQFVLQLKHQNDVIEDSIKQEYVDWSLVDDPEADFFDPWNNLAGDSSFGCPVVMETRAHGKAAEFDIYQYYFTHTPSVSYYNAEYTGPGWLGAAHAEELAFVFGWPFHPPIYYDYHSYREEEMHLSQNMMKYWTNFAKTGNPNKESEESDPYSDDRSWPAFTVPNLDYKELAVNLTSGRGVRADKCHFWNIHLKQLTTFTADLEEVERQWREEFYSWKHTDMEEWRDAFDENQSLVNAQLSKDEL